MGARFSGALRLLVSSGVTGWAQKDAAILAAAKPVSRAFRSLLSEGGGAGREGTPSLAELAGGESCLGF